MAKPTSIPEWATSGTARLDPGPERRVSGFVPGQRLPARWLNHVLGQGADWFAYLRDLHLEGEFLNKVYAWTARHRFTAGLTSLAAIGLAAGAEIAYTDAAGALTPRTRTVDVPITTFGAIGTAWALGEEVLALGNTHLYWFTLVTGSAESKLIGEFSVPAGWRLTAAHVSAQLTDSSINVMVGYQNVTGDFGAAGTLLAGPTTYQNLDGEIDVPVGGDAAQEQWRTAYVRILHVGGVVVVRRIALTFEVAGPR